MPGHLRFGQIRKAECNVNNVTVGGPRSRASRTTTWSARSVTTTTGRQSGASAEGIESACAVAPATVNATAPKDLRGARAVSGRYYTFREKLMAWTEPSQKTACQVLPWALPNRQCCV